MEFFDKQQNQMFISCIEKYIIPFLSNPEKVLLLSHDIVGVVGYDFGFGRFAYDLLKIRVGAWDSNRTPDPFLNIEPRNKPFDYQGNEIIIDNEEIRNFQYKLDKKIKINASLTTCEAAFGVGLATFDPDTSESFGGIPANKSIIGVPGNCKFYITANENCGMINIGHCNTTNEYEMKLLINTIFFLHNQNKQ